jgi:hypothetical protein
MLYDLLNNSMVAEYTLVHLGFNTFRLRGYTLSRNLIIWEPYSTNSINQVISQTIVCQQRSKIIRMSGGLLQLQ